jgi:drug/metabolite transporter (DMT)-like permease
MPAALSRHHLRAELSLAGVTIIWGTTFVLVKAALEDVSPILFLAIRFALAAIVLLILYRATHSSLRLFRHPKAGVAGLLAGACLALGYLFQTVGLQYTSPSKSAFITSLCVVLVPLLSLIVYRSVPGVGEILAIGVAMSGMWLLTAPETGTGWNAGDLLTLAAATAFAAHVLVLARYAPVIGFAPISLLQVCGAAAAFAGTFFWLERPRIILSPAVIAAILITAVFCTALAFTIQAWAQQQTTASRTALIFALEPISAAATSYMILGEILSRSAAAGAALILAAVVWVEVRPQAAPETFPPKAASMNS